MFLLSAGVDSSVACSLIYKSHVSCSLIGEEHCSCSLIGGEHGSYLVTFILVESSVPAF